MKASHANRGKELETLVEYANDQYINKGLFAGFQVPTPMNKDKQGQAFYKKKSTVDFVGLYKGTPVAFDCKQTSVKTNFPFKNIHDHQLEFMDQWQQQGGFSFFLVEFTKQNKIFVLSLDQLQEFKRNNTRKSIPFNYFEENCFQPRQIISIVLHYLEYIDLTQQ